MAAVCLAVAAAGVGGWAVGAASPAATTASAQGGQAASPLIPASLVAAGGQNIGKVFLYSGSPQWVYMSVDLDTGNESVTCQLVTADGKTHTLGSFQLADGYGSWASPNPGNIKNVTGARLLSATGSILATATFQR